MLSVSLAKGIRGIPGVPTLLQTETGRSVTPTGNRLLDALPPAMCDTILRAGRMVDLPVRTCLSNPGETPSAVYLLTRGVTSIVVNMASGGSAEVGMVGNEGIINAAALIGPSPAHSETFIQLAASGLRVPLRAFRELFEQEAELRHYVLQFIQAQVVITSQLSACNRLHEAEQRLARWLLTAADLLHADTMLLTQEFLAEMLGAQRTTVALVAGALQRGKLIDYSRGLLHITDRAGLERTACDCYQVNRQALARLYQSRF